MTARVPGTGGGVVGKAGSGLVLLVAAAYAAKLAYEWLMPLVPSVLVLLGLWGLLALLIRTRSR